MLPFRGAASTLELSVRLKPTVTVPRQTEYTLKVCAFEKKHWNIMELLNSLTASRSICFSQRRQKPNNCMGNGLNKPPGLFTAGRQSLRSLAMLQPHQPDPNTTGCPVPPPCHYKTSRPLERTGGQAQTGGAGIWKAQVLGLGVKATRGILNKNKQTKKHTTKKELSSSSHNKNAIPELMRFW